MPTHDIIDNRNEKLVDHINKILHSTERARFAVGYFFLSGLVPLADKLQDVSEIRLLIGNISNRETLEQLSEGYKRLELVRESLEAQVFHQRVQVKRFKAETAANIRQSIALMDQEDAEERIISILAKLIEEKRLIVKVYTKGRMHAKAYVFDYKADGRYEKGIGIVGSSNLTLAGITHNTELNVVVHGNDNHAELVRWFEDLWNEAYDFDETLMQEMKTSWALAAVTPYDIYMKTLYELVRDRLEGGEDKEILWDDEITKDLADFQKVAVKQAVQMIKDYNGCFVADVVGLGKSFIGAAIVKHFERTRHAHPLIICPASLVDMWRIYNATYRLNAEVLSMGMLKENENAGNFLKEHPLYKHRDFVLVDESHNFRHSHTQRYTLLQDFLGAGRNCCFLTATPRNRGARDIYNQIKLFHQDDTTDLPVNPPNLIEYFNMIERGERRLQDMLLHILIRRTRKHIIRWYGYDSETHQKVNPSEFRQYLDGKKRAYIIVGGKHRFFPRRNLETIEYSIEDTYAGLYDRIRRCLGTPQRREQQQSREKELSYARYGLWHYVLPDKKKAQPYSQLHRAGQNLRGLMRILLFKRFESSVYAFRESLHRMMKIHDRYIAALENGIVPAGEDAQEILYASDELEEQALLDALAGVSGTYDIHHFNYELLIEHVTHDRKLLAEMLEWVKPITAKDDVKYRVLCDWFNKPLFKKGKKLIFTQYADTAWYLYSNLNPDDEYEDIEVIYSGDKSKPRIVGRFAPKANPQYRLGKGEVKINTLIATDVLSEGLNLQDCDKIINYDLHWNPVRLIQRIGRIDRIGSEHDEIYAYNFLPETKLEEQLGLKQKLQNRIKEIHETIGEDTAILDPSEQLNEEAMYAIYEQKGGLDAFEEEDDIIDLHEAEEYFRLLEKNDPAELERIKNLRDGIRSAKSSERKGVYVFCAAGNYQKLYLADDNGSEISSDVPEVLKRIRCDENEKALPLPKDHNRMVMSIKKKFDEEVKHRLLNQRHRLSLTLGQKYVLRELRLMFEGTRDEEIREQLNTLDEAFRKPVTAAVKRQLNSVKRNGLAGDDLKRELTRIYLEHGLKDREISAIRGCEELEIPRIICSEAIK